MDPLKTTQVKGCLLGGAVGDALGSPVEFWSLDKIRTVFGPAGVTGFEDYARKGVPFRGEITDDTQMTLFTAEGLLRAYNRGRQRGILDLPAVVYHAYIRWLHTQGAFSGNPDFDPNDDGWLVQLPKLHHRREPGNTCLSALRSGKMGTVDHPLNDSKGCGGVMRAAPAGLIASGWDPFELGVKTAVITHGHPSGYLPAGCLAQMVSDLVAGQSLQAALEHAVQTLQKWPRHEECLQALKAAQELWSRGRSQVTAEAVESLGAGWTGEEALAIGVYSALAAEGDFARGVCLAVNHSGDSDSTGSITGNLLGAGLGVAAIPPHWLGTLELRDEIEALAEDLVTLYRDDPQWSERYPGW